MFNRCRAVALSCIAATILAAGAPAMAQTFPDPSDTAKLYEAAKKEGKIVWYITTPLDAMNAIAAKFQERYPGISVQALRIVGVQQYQRFMQETQAKQYIADNLQLGDRPSVTALIDDKLLASWKVPTADRIPEAFRIGDYAYATHMTDNAIIYNVNKLTPEEVKILSDWKGVLDPRFKGRFAVTTQKCGSCYAPVHMFLDPKYKDIYGVEFLKKVAAQKPAVYSEVLVPVDRVVAGEQDFTFWSWEAAGIVKLQQGAPIRWIHPKPTPTYSNSWSAISAFAPHPNAARLFQNWLLSEEGATAFQQIYGAQTALGGVPDKRAVTKEPWYDPITEPYLVDTARWERDYDKDMNLWIKILRDAQQP
ncbi:extracellular solute-binding protein [Aquabacter sp. CN5-332]|uniref:ABC transporter substrate-binding protein n=1 Tax=Aquabacter sp. CN5-332 TaxID=3156608 RepID=UPI0032B339CA